MRTIQFKLDSLTQQLQLAKDKADRTSKELAKRSEDFANYHHEKHAALTQVEICTRQIARSPCLDATDIVMHTTPSLDSLCDPLLACKI